MKILHVFFIIPWKHLSIPCIGMERVAKCCQHTGSSYRVQQGRFSNMADTEKWVEAYAEGAGTKLSKMTYQTHRTDARSLIVTVYSTNYKNCDAFT